jgi:hypothetical protein
MKALLVSLIILLAAPVFAQEHLSATHIGNTTYFSNGVTAQNIGNTTFFSNGNSCTTVGNSAFCN